MNNVSRIVLKSVSWIVVAGFAAVSVLVGVLIHRLLVEAKRPGSVLYCGNSVTGPIAALLNIGTPIAFAAVIVIGFLWKQKLASGGSVIMAALLSMTCTTTLVLYGIHFYHDYLPGEHFSDTVWWMKPAGALFAI